MKNVYRLTLTICASVLACATGGVSAYAGNIDVAEVDRRAKALMKKRGMVGMAVAVIDDGEITFAKGYGTTMNTSAGKPVTGDTVFRWASVSKSVAAATALDVAADGHFGLSSPVEAFVSRAEFPKTRRPITLEQILSHRTGLPRNAYDPVIEDGRSETHVKNLLEDSDYACRPGSCHTYQNVAYDLSTDMIETATGVPYASAVNERIFDPLGMETATLSHEGLVQSVAWARPHNSAGYPYNSVKRTYFRIAGSAGVSSSVTDLAKWVQANMELGTSGDADIDVLPADLRQEMQTARTRTPRRARQMQRKYPFLKNARYGLGWRIYEYEGGNSVVGHRGAVQGYRANVMFDPKTRDGVILLWNSNSSRPNGLAYEVMDQSYGKRRRDWLALNAKKPGGLRVIRQAPQ